LTFLVYAKTTSGRAWEISDIYSDIYSQLASADDIKNFSDTELVRKFRETRDNVIVGELFKRYTHLVFGVCLKYLKDEDKAKDGVMEVFEKILTGLHRHDIDNFKGWLYMVAKNYCLMYFRSKKNHVELPAYLTGDSSEDSFDSSFHSFSHLQESDGRKTGEPLNMEFISNIHLTGEDSEKQLSLMEEAIKELKKQQKLCIELFYLQEKSYEEVAKITGYTLKEVKSYIQNGKRNLKISMITKSVGNKQNE
jgi:RNA polymerase sigma factor (sigma-70 family)